MELYHSMKGDAGMDKDMERLGKERLKECEKTWTACTTFIISMAVIVLGITAYRLIQPASAEDQNKYRVRGGWTEGNIYQSGEA